MNGTLKNVTDPTSRALALLGLLESRRTWSGPELAQRLAVTPRTVRRDIDRLRSLGYRIDAGPGAEGGYALGRGQVIPPLLLDEDEALAVTVALLGASASGLAADGDAALRALGKLDDVLPGPLRQRSRELRRSIAVVGPANAPATSAAALGRVAEAVRRHRRLRFRYTARLDAVSDRRVEPHLLVSKDRLWYLLAYDLERADWRTFRVDRMSDVERQEWEFKPRPDVAQARARMEKGMPQEAYRHRVDVLYDAALEDMAAQAPTMRPFLSQTSSGTRMLTGADDPDNAAWWLCSFRFPFRVLGDGAVQAAVDRLAERLQGAVNAAADGPEGPPATGELV